MITMKRRWAVTVKNYVARIPQVDKQTGENYRVPVRIRRIELDGPEHIEFPVTLRKGRFSFGDSRHNDKSFAGTVKGYTGFADFMAELTRLVGQEQAAQALAEVLGEGDE